MWVSDSMGNNIGWQQMGTWDFPGATPNLVPVNTAVSPSSGSGGAQMFTVTVSDGNGEQDIAHTQLTINDTQDVANACSIFYNRLANWVGLYNDAGTAWTNATLGSAVTLSNSFCSLEVAGVTETVSGNDLMVSFPIVFSGAVLGAQNVYLLTRDKSGFEAGWDSMGTWTVTAHSSTPAVLAIAPNSGNVTSATFTAIYVDGTGAADMSWSYVMFNQVVDWAGSCGVRYNLADNLVYVVNDAGSGWTTGQAPGTATTLSNSTCDLDVSGVTVDQTGLVLTVTYPLTFTTSFSATRNIKMYASDSTANSGWQQMGTWDFPGGTPNEVPVNGTLSPSSGSGGSQTFTVTGSDGNGAQDIAQIFWLINTGITGVNACYLRYNQVANLAYLLNDLGNSWGTGATPGSVTTLTNSFCTVQMAGATVSAVGNDLTLTYPIVFDGTAQGAKNIYQLTRDNSGYQDGWDQVGTWTIVQVIVDVTPPSVTFLQSGETQQFTANVSNATDPSVTWSYSPQIGTLNPSTGLYQAPSPIAGGDTITITATSVEDPKKSDTATVLLVPVAVNVTPFSASVATNQSAQFTATVDGSTNTNVTWSLGAGDPGSITQTGLYSPPNPITATATVTVTATSQADPNKSDWATVDVLFVQISMVPTSATVHVGETAEFFATATFSDINWSLGAGSPGSLSPLIVSSSSATYLYTPPASIAQDETATVIVEATTDPTRTATATVNLVSTEVSVAPSSANLQINQQQQFTAAVTGHPNTNVTWSVSPSVGAISSTGLYTAPSTLSSPQAVTVAATSVADPVKSANATVNLEPVVVSLSPSTASLQINQQQQFTATVTGNADTSVTWSLGAGNPGTISASGLYTAPASIATQQNISCQEAIEMSPVVGR